MTRLHATLLLALILLTGCNSLEQAKQESLEAVDNLKTEATEIKEGVDIKLQQIETAKDSVVNAASAVNQAKEDVKALTE